MLDFLSSSKCQPTHVFETSVWEIPFTAWSQPLLFSHQNYSKNSFILEPKGLLLLASRLSESPCLRRNLSFSQTLLWLSITHGIKPRKISLPWSTEHHGPVSLSPSSPSSFLPSPSHKFLPHLFYLTSFYSFFLAALQCYLPGECGSFPHTMR